MCACVRPVEEQRGSVQCTLYHRHSLGVLAALVCTREDSMQQKAKNSEGHVTLNGQCADKMCVCVCLCCVSFSFCS